MPPTDAPPPDDALVAVGPAARLIHVSPNTLRAWADDGRVRVYRTPTNQRRFRVGDLRALLKAENNEPAGQAS